VLGGLMLLGVGSALFVSLAGASRNTTALLADKADLILSSIEQRVRQHLDPAKAQAEYLAGLMESGSLDPADEAATAAALRASLAASPQVTGVAFIGADGRVLRVERDGGLLVREDWSNRPKIMELMAGFRTDRGLDWGAPTWSEPFRQTILPVTAPVRRDGRLIGLVAPALLIKDLSRYVAGLSAPDQTTFILLGKDAVIAHPGLAEGGPGRSVESPLPRVDQVGDPVLASIWQAKADLRFPLKPGDKGHVVTGPSDYTVFIYRQIQGYGERPWIVGAAMPGREAGQEFDRLFRMALGGLFLLLVAVASAVLVARRIARPIDELVRVTQAVQRLELKDAPVLPRSRVRELDAAGQALNGMVAALRWFELYLPRRLVHALISGATPAWCGRRSGR
jgi:HAMP domain-containing protein